MDDRAFWALVEGCGVDSGGDLTAHARSLRLRLADMDPDDILGFRDRWDVALRRVDRPEVRDAAALLLGDGGEEPFRDLRSWIVSRGAATLTRVVADPDTLAEFAVDVSGLGGAATMFDFLAERVYQDATGLLPTRAPSRMSDLSAVSGPPATTPSPVPAGARADAPSAPPATARFPRLAALRAASYRRDPDPSECCPTCGGTLVATVFGSLRRADRDADGQAHPWDDPAAEERQPGDSREYRRCGACRAVLWRTSGERSWRRDPPSPASLAGASPA